SIEIPNSVESIGDDAFCECYSLTSVTIGENVTSIDDNAFENCYSLTSIEMPDSLTSLGSYCFSGCSSLTSIKIPSNVTSIGSYCFSGCRSLTSVNFINTSGWWVSTSSSATSGKTISSTDLANTSTAATYLNSTNYYCGYYWKRS
ncbi:MAG: leucine-rich repeat domain-containing protein, partial [Clostridia bacterium]|nr:leucine-rich repeat domain-containing protein [Clostridia bacterium]